MVWREAFATCCGVNLAGEWFSGAIWELAWWVRSAHKSPGDDGAAGAAGGLFGFGGEGGFEGVGVEVNFAGGDLFGCCSVETKFADAEAFFCSQRRAENAAGHGAGGVEVAESGGGIEGRAGFVVGEVFEVGAVFVEKAGARVAGEIWREAGDGLSRSLAEGEGAFGIGGIESGESLAQAGCVQLGDGEDADATLRASRSAQEPGAGAAGSVGDGGVNDLDELCVAGGERHEIRIEQGGDEGFFIGERYSAGW
jgi:hypothetical protein